jgi:hypothetical protein
VCDNVGNVRASELWHGRFFERDARFWPLAPAARRFADYADFPAPEELAAPGVVFVSAGKPRRARRAAAPEAAYDARIERGEVPTRPRSWHDFLNALVWATFPASKRRIHELQAAFVRRARDNDSTRLPNARAREHDALALLDEGGVLVLADARSTLTLGFGHALYEGLVRGGPAATASSLTFDVDALPEPANAPALADALLAARLGAPFSPEALDRRAF